MNILPRLRDLSAVPADEDKYRQWLEPSGAITTLEQNAIADDIVVYAGLDHVFWHAVTVPAGSVSPPDAEDLMNWRFGVSAGWGITHGGNPSGVWLSPPMEHTSSATLDEGVEPLLFHRFFEGHLGDKNYIEVDQRFTQAFGLHLVSERRAYCHLNHLGDLVDAVNLNAKAPGGQPFNGTVVTVRRDLLEQWMVLTDRALVVLFDFTRNRLGSGIPWESGTTTRQIGDDLSYRHVVVDNIASYSRGYQVVRIKRDRDEVIAQLTGVENEPKDYASFISFDWKNKLVKEISCAPDSLANYFMQSDLPFETTPAFFRAEVLAKYKADPDKYQLKQRSLSCRGAWSLKTYDINEAGQIHTYLCYLQDLPFEEQQHWKAYNETPKAGLSKRAIATDFGGRFSEEYDPLPSLKKAILQVSELKMPWWTRRTEEQSDRTHYPATTSAEEWASEIMNLDQLLIEAFKSQWLRQKAESLGRSVDPKFGSLKLIEECLMGSGFDESTARALTAPLHEVHQLRSKLKGHSNGAEALDIRRRALSDHGTLRKHFQELCRRIDESFRQIVPALRALV